LISSRKKSCARSQSDQTAALTELCSIAARFISPLYDPAADRIEWLLGIGQDRAETIVLSRNGNLLFASNNASETVTIAERMTNIPDWKLSILHVGDQPQGIDISPDGRQVWVSNEGDDIVSVIDVAAKKVAGTFRVGTQSSSRMKFTPDGKHVVLTDRDRGQLVVIDAASRKVTLRIPNLGKRVTDLVLSADGTRAYASAQLDNAVAVVDLEKLQFTKQIPTGRDPEGVAWVGTE
jgi:YVTN family beta-propeller protein